MNQIDQLIRLANRIGNFFDAMPDRAEGLEGVANHIQKFWEPRMRIRMLEFLDKHPDGKTDNEALNPLTLAAITENKERLTPKSTV
ncbi:MAG TPA: formate dehydrogenase subunit delta [Eoetvoesiella sp.]|uniref:formate dehydrogenase subunit delta n=1 Tax=Eoetvoesiella sp. TaxID=1966355 RepID=UPI002C5EB34F|nr:formate dehydrogenase subunit delta [Eoetvoesiella sp.]HWK60895.1 formate dehydrogenase subunit delta [Eoetvoesiella sp.]